LEGDELAGIRNKEIGFVFQNFHLLARNSALDNVMLPLKYAGIDKLDQIGEQQEPFLKLGLSLEWIISHQSFQAGQQQRVAIARALVNKPVYFIC
jgi:putative ABC transport system ATP-binding protein